MESAVLKIKEGIKKRVEKRIINNNIVERLIKNGLNVNIGKESRNAVAEIVKTNVSKIAKDKAKNTTYKLIKEKAQNNIKKGLAEYAIQKSKSFFGSITKAEIKEMKKKIEAV